MASKPEASCRAVSSGALHTSMAAAISPRPNAFHALSSESSASLFSGTSEPRKLPFTVSVTSESAASVITLLYDGRRFTAIPRVAATNTPRHGYQQRTLTRDSRRFVERHTASS